MLGGVPPLDLSALLPYVATAIAIVSGVLLLLRSAASRYFAVEAPFGLGEVMSIGRGEEEGDVGTTCRVCGNAGSKVCTGCKSVRYCSPDCQRKHWKEHKLKCRKKVSGSAIALIPGHVSPNRGAHKVLRKPQKILFPYDEFVKLFYWDKQAFTPCGLLNCGNSCFANVVLQCLASTRPLVAYLLEGSHSGECRRDDWCFLCELQLHVQRVSSKSQPFSPMSILSRLPSISSNLGYGRQEDAHEFMRFAIDTMQSVCLDEYGGEKALDASTQESTLVQHIFGGHLQSQVKCTNCNMVSNRYENMMDLTVEIQGDAESLESCLDQFTAKEWLDGDNKYKCDGCNGYVKAWKRLTIHRAPNILTIALKRFQSGRFGKLNKRVIFPETLDLGPYMSNAGGNENLYSLYAIVVHLDMLNASFFGHYICYTKDFYGQWFRIDDCKVAKVDIEEVLSQGAYMLLYSRLEVRLPMALEPAKGSTPAAAVSSLSASADNTQESNLMEILSIGTTSIGFEEKTDTDMDMPQASGTASSLCPSVNSSVSQSVDIKEQDSSSRKNLSNGGTSICQNLDSLYGSDELMPSKGKFIIESPEGESVSESFRRDSGIGAGAGLVAPFKHSVDFRMDMAPEPHLTCSNGPELNTGICTNSHSVNTISDGKSTTPSASSRGSSSSKEPRPLFSRGFYDRPRKKKPLPLTKEASMEVSATGANGSSNGFCEPKIFGNGNGKSELQSSTQSSDHGIKNIILNGESKDNTVDGVVHLFDEGNSSCYGHRETESSLNAGTRPPLPQLSLDRPIEQQQSVNKLGETLENGFPSITSYNGTSHSVPIQSHDEMSEGV